MTLDVFAGPGWSYSQPPSARILEPTTGEQMLKLPHAGSPALLLHLAFIR
jgi:hypothetical protein